MALTDRLRAFMNPPQPKKIGVTVMDYNKAYFPIYATPTGPYKFPMVIRGLATIATTILGLASAVTLAFAAWGAFCIAMWTVVLAIMIATALILDQKSVVDTAMFLKFCLTAAAVVASAYAYFGILKLCNAIRFWAGQRTG